MVASLRILANFGKGAPFVPRRLALDAFLRNATPSMPTILAQRPSPSGGFSGHDALVRYRGPIAGYAADLRIPLKLRRNSRAEARKITEVPNPGRLLAGIGMRALRERCI